MMSARLDAAIRTMLAALLLCGVVSAQETQSRIGSRGHWDLAVWVAGSTGEENINSFTEAQILTAGFFAARGIGGEVGRGWFRGRMEYGFGVVPVFATSGSQHLRGGGFEPVIFRWNFVQCRPRVAPYVELAGGGVFTPANLPPGDTSSFNFMLRPGGGIYLFTRRRQSLDLGFRYQHISNANLGVRNPAFNGLQLTIGYHWYK